jgi:hypothetical protein
MTELRVYTGEGRWEGINLPSFEGPGSEYVEGFEPWRLGPGESYLDNMPTGVEVVPASYFSESDDIYAILEAVETSPLTTAGVYVELDAKTYYLSSFRSYSTDDWRGFANATRHVMGLIGQGPDSTFIRVRPDAVSSSPGAADHVLNATGGSPGTPVAVIALYFSNTTTDVPLFFSGITFDGTLQTPFTTYSTASQASFRRNHAVPSPLAWRGISLWRCIEGSRMQYCRLRGFGYALNTAPPFEAGAIETNYDDGFVLTRTEIDGRVPGSLYPTRPRASGGLMWNKGIDATVTDSWQHHTRRSGWATNTNTNGQGERYVAVNFQVEEIANDLDGYAGDNGGFNGANVEEVVGIFTIENGDMSIANGAHINWALPYRSSGADQLTTVSSHPVIEVHGFQTDDVLYGGCLRIRVTQNPNSTGTSPAYTYLVNNGVSSAVNLFDVRDSEGEPLTPVRHNAFNPSLHGPDTHYVVIY